MLDAEMKRKKDTLQHGQYLIPTFEPETTSSNKKIQMYELLFSQF